MKRNINSRAAGLLFGVFFAAVDIAVKLSYGSRDLSGLIVHGLITGAVVGLVFGLYAHRSTKRQAEEFESLRSRLSQEGEIVYEAPANHFYGDEFVGGWLFLTETCLYFMANPMNVLSHSLRLELEDVEEVRILRQLGFNNGVAVETSDGVHRFSLSRPKLWQELIDKKTTSEV